MNNLPLLKVKNLIAGYEKNVILDGISFDVCPGEIFMVIGASGCGKTTLLQNMIGLLEPFSGEVIIDGESITNLPDRERLSILRKIGVLYQSNALFGSLSLLDNVAFPLEQLTDLPKEAIIEISRDKLKIVGLGGFADYMPAQISGGMQKRAALARAMGLDPKILFLDEPTSGLDPIISSEIDQLVVNLSDILGITFVIVSHDVTSICKIAHRVILLNEKRVIASGSPKKLRDSEHPFVNRFFAGK